MIDLQNKTKGFGLIEAMLAIAIMGLVLAPMFLLQTNVFNAVMRGADRFSRLILAKNFLYSAQQDEPIESRDYSVEKKEEKPMTLLSYKLKPVSSKSALSQINGLLQQTVTASGTQAADPKAELITFIYKAESGSDEKK